LNFKSSIAQLIVAAIIAIAAVPCRGASLQPDSLTQDKPFMSDSTMVLVADSTQMLVADSAVVLVTDSAQAAKIDSLASRIGAMLKPPFKPDPTRALWLSLVLPGAGQIYNHKYWKLPIVYGGFLGCAYALNWNGQMLSDYSQAYLDIMDNDPNTKSYEKMLPLNYSIAGREEQFKEIFKNKKNYYRKYRDMSIMAFAAVYALAVIDAYVDAELSSFDISEDLSLQVQPTLIKPIQQTSDWRHHGLGLSVCLRY